jgi:ribonuclease HI
MIHGSCLNAGKINASGGVAAYWGQHSHRNKTGRPWGNQTGPRAELLAALLAIKRASPAKSLEISTTSDYVIHSVKYYAATHNDCGWRCVNGDILKIILALIKIQSKFEQRRYTFVARTPKERMNTSLKPLMLLAQHANYPAAMTRSR